MLSVDLASAWTPRWKAFRDKAVRAWRTSVAVNPASYLPQVQQFTAALWETRQLLDRCGTKVAAADRERLVALETRYALLTAGLYADARPASPVQGVPVGVVIGGLVIGVAGIAWAVAALQYAVNLRERTALLDKELDARVLASREGRELAPSSLPAAGPDLKRTGWMLVGALALVTVGVAVPAFVRRSA